MVLRRYTKRLLPFTSVLALCVFLCAGTASAAAFQNGSFESGTAFEPFRPVNVGATNITGWDVTAGNVDFITTLWQAHDGTRSIDLDGGTAGTIAQTFDTISGHPYQVEFWLAANPYGSTTKTAEVDATGVGNNPQQFTFDWTDHTHIDMGWEQHFYSFVADGSSTTLSFASLTTGNAGPAVDAVSVTDTYTEPPVGAPEPGVMILLLAGLVAVASATKVKSKS